MDEIAFVLREHVDGVEVGPRTISLSRFNQFNREAEDFVAGSRRGPLEDVRVRIEDGSYRLVAVLGAVSLGSLRPDLESLRREDSLGDIDPKRAAVIARWQRSARESRDLAYEIAGAGLDRPIRIDRSADFRAGGEPVWIRVERYLSGEVVDMGGAGKPNIHLRLPGRSRTIRIESDVDSLRGQDVGRLYRPAVVRVSAEQNRRTRELRNLRLLGFETRESGFDEAAFAAAVAEGTKAWAGVGSASAWVERMRGGES